MTLVTQSAAIRMPDCEGADGKTANAASPASNGSQTLQRQIAGKFDSARKSVSDHLGMLLSTHMGSGGLRNGTILRDCIEVMTRQAGQLINAVFDDLDVQPKTPVILQEIREGIIIFIEFLDGELDRSAQRVELELEHASGRNSLTVAARNLWSEYRNKLIDELEHRIEQSHKLKEPARDEAVADDHTDANESPLPANDLPEPGFELLVKDVSPAPSAPVKSLALEGLAVQRVQFGPDPQAKPDTQDLPTDTESWLEVWADMIAEICSSNSRPRKKAEWRDAFQKVCERNQIEPDAAVLDEWANLVWRKLITSRFILSEVGKEIRREAAISGEDEGATLSFHVTPSVSSGSSGGFESLRGCEGSAVRVIGPGEAVRKSPEPARNLLTAIAVAMPVIEIG